MIPRKNGVHTDANAASVPVIRVVREIKVLGSDTHVSTNNALAPMPTTRFIRADGQWSNCAYEALFRRTRCGDSAMPSIAAWKYLGPTELPRLEGGPRDLR